jgi:hypothetical protein
MGKMPNGLGNRHQNDHYNTLRDLSTYIYFPVRIRINRLKGGLWSNGKDNRLQNDPKKTALMT